MELKPLFKHPVGASEHCSDLSTFSENAPEVISCQLCGTKYLKYKDDCDYSDCYFNFLGYRGIIQCCGKLMDILYQQWGEVFFNRTLSEIKENFSSERHAVIKEQLNEVFLLVKQYKL